LPLMPTMKIDRLRYGPAAHRPHRREVGQAGPANRHVGAGFLEGFQPRDRVGEVRIGRAGKILVRRGAVSTKGKDKPARPPPLPRPRARWAWADIVRGACPLSPLASSIEAADQADHRRPAGSSPLQPKRVSPKPFSRFGRQPGKSQGRHDVVAAPGASALLARHPWPFAPGLKMPAEAPLEGGEGLRSPGRPRDAR